MSEGELVFVANDREVRFTSESEVRTWLQEERAAWSWLDEPPHEPPVHHACREAVNTLDQMMNEVASIEQRPDLDISALGNVMIQGFGVTGPAFYSRSQIGARLLDIKAASGIAAAKFALAFVRQRVTMANAANADSLRGALQLVMPEGVEATALAERMAKERSNFRDAARTVVEEGRVSATKRDQEWSIERAQVRNLAARMLRRRQNKFAASQSRQEIVFSEAVEGFRQTETAYRETMRLKAPVEYWEKKAEKHKTDEKAALKRLAIFFPAALILLGCTFFAAGWLVLNKTSEGSHPTAPIALYVVISGGLATTSAVVFWIGRLLTKLYLSEHHLRHDAEERAVMTTTYLALTAEKAAEEEDRKIILSALFRSTPDGIVKDDGPADFGGLATILARLGMK